MAKKGKKSKKSRSRHNDDFKSRLSGKNSVGSGVSKVSAKGGPSSQWASSRIGAFGMAAPPGSEPTGLGAIATAFKRDIDAMASGNYKQMQDVIDRFSKDSEKAQLRFDKLTEYLDNKKISEMKDTETRTAAFKDLVQASTEKVNSLGAQIKGDLQASKDRSMREIGDERIAFATMANQQRLKIGEQGDKVKATVEDAIMKGREELRKQEDKIGHAGKVARDKFDGFYQKKQGELDHRITTTKLQVGKMGGDISRNINGQHKRQVKDMQEYLSKLKEVQGNMNVQLQTASGIQSDFESKLAGHKKEMVDMHEVFESRMSHRLAEIQGIKLGIPTRMEMDRDGGSVFERQMDEMKAGHSGRVTATANEAFDKVLKGQSFTQRKGRVKARVPLENGQMPQLLEAKKTADGATADAASVTQEPTNADIEHKASAEAGKPLYDDANRAPWSEVGYSRPSDSGATDMETKLEFAPGFTSLAAARTNPTMVKKKKARTHLQTSITSERVTASEYDNIAPGNATREVPDDTDPTLEDISANQAGVFF